MKLTSVFRQWSHWGNMFVPQWQDKSVPQFRDASGIKGSKDLFWSHNYNLNFCTGFSQITSVLILQRTIQKLHLILVILSPIQKRLMRDGGEGKLQMVSQACFLLIMQRKSRSSQLKKLNQSKEEKFNLKGYVQEPSMITKLVSTGNISKFVYDPL